MIIFFKSNFIFICLTIISFLFPVFGNVNSINAYNNIYITAPKIIYIPGWKNKGIPQDE